MKGESIRKLTRRQFLRGAAAAAAAAALEPLAPSYARAGIVDRRGVIDGRAKTDLTIARHALSVAGRVGNALGINGSVPGPLVRLREGERALLRVRNDLDVDTSIHWHGLLVPADMDGVPGLSFAGIRPGETFAYEYDVRQSGTYWYHSHSALQEQSGVYGPLVIDPAEREPFEYDREYVVMLSDWTFEDPHRVMSKLKTMSGYYNYQRRTLMDLAREVSQGEWRQAIASRLAWGRMRMDPTDIADVTGTTYTYLMNGLAPESNWTGLVRPGERVRLRLINGSAMTYFDVRIPGLPMTVVQADGQNVKPVAVDELRIAVAETYDVVVALEDDRAFTIFAESMDRSGYARGTLAPRPGLTSPIPAPRPRPLRTMADMGMGEMDMPGMSMGGTAGRHDMHAAGESEKASAEAHSMAGMSMGGAAERAPVSHAGPASSAPSQGPGADGATHSMVATMPRDRLSEPGAGLGEDGWRVLVYRDLEAAEPFHDRRAPERELELHLTGNMERYMWSFDGEKFSEVIAPIEFRHGERIRLSLVNDTMMEHPIHLHGMWMELENGRAVLPRKHTVNVKPGERLSARISADARGDWAFHCHLLYHMEMGMFRVVRVSG